jgi:hypothetical protein
MNIESISYIYWKLKFSFLKQVKLHNVTGSMFTFLNSHYGKSKCKIKTSYFRQLNEMKNILNVDFFNMSKKDVNNLLLNIFRSEDQDLVKAVRNALVDCENLDLCRDAVRKLLWVEFEKQPFIVLNDL